MTALSTLTKGRLGTSDDDEVNDDNDDDDDDDDKIHLFCIEPAFSPASV